MGQNQALLWSSTNAVDSVRSPAQSRGIPIRAREVFDLLMAVELALLLSGDHGGSDGIIPFFSTLGTIFDFGCGRSLVVRGSRTMDALVLVDAGSVIL